jgi:hypothetical protein
MNTLGCLGVFRGVIIEAHIYIGPFCKYFAQSVGTFQKCIIKMVTVLD